MHHNTVNTISIAFLWVHCSGTFQYIPKLPELHVVVILIFFLQASVTSVCIAAFALYTYRSKISMESVSMDTVQGHSEILCRLCCWLNGSYTVSVPERVKIKLRLLAFFCLLTLCAVELDSWHVGRSVSRNYQHLQFRCMLGRLPVLCVV